MDKRANPTLFLTKYISQFETNIGRCLVPSLIPKATEKREADEEEGGEEEEEQVPVLNKGLLRLKPYQDTEEIQTPHLCIWDFLPKEELESFLKITSQSELRAKLEERMTNVPTGFSRVIAIEFLTDVTNYCRRSTFDLEQSGSIISIFYWAYRFFTTNLFVCPEYVYNYFAEFLAFHCLFFPPTHAAIFSIEEGEALLMYFCRMYLRHLPLVRMLTLPNFGFELQYVLEPEMKFDKKKKGKKKDKKDKKDKKKKKK